MNRKFPTLVLAAMVCLVGFFACATGKNDPSLSLPDAFPKTMKVGDTVSVLAIKKARDVQGRMVTNSSYTGYYLVSGDSTVARIAIDRLLIGVDTGTTTITAMDKDPTSGLISGKYTITVVAR